MNDLAASVRARLLNVAKLPQACQSDVVTIEPWMNGGCVRCVCFD